MAVRLGTVASLEVTLSLGGSVAPRGYLPLGGPRAQKGIRRELHMTHLLDVISRCVQSVALATHIFEALCHLKHVCPATSCWQSGVMCQAPSTALFTLPWPTETCLMEVSRRSGIIALKTKRHRPASSSVPCPALLDASLFSFCSTVGMVVTLEAGNPCTKPRV